MNNSSNNNNNNNDDDLAALVVAVEGIGANVRENGVKLREVDANARFGVIVGVALLLFIGYLFGGRFDALEARFDALEARFYAHESKICETAHKEKNTTIVAPTGVPENFPFYNLEGEL